METAQVMGEGSDRTSLKARHRERKGRRGWKKFFLEKEDKQYHESGGGRRCGAIGYWSNGPDLFD